ncbi:MAG: zinc ribbon domain-containing protein [Pyrinomonadaceae bacterium]|nr:zinc ribbon domain-containing protein [Pyrinomonadaceae bacterium]
MFCPECGTQNPDTAKFCVRCGYQNPIAGGAVGSPMSHPVMVAAPASSGSKLPWVLGVVALLVITGLVGFIALRGSRVSNQEDNPTPRARNSANSSNSTPNAAAPTVSSPATTSPAGNSSVATSSPAPSSPTPNPTATPAPKVAKKPVDCDKKCYQVYDQCMADYRQHPDPETICRGRQTICLSKCQ